MNPLIHLRKATQLFIVVVCFGFSPVVWAISPPPDGGYPNGNTAEGFEALLSLTTGSNNTADGFQALLNNTTGSENTALGWRAFHSNHSGRDNTATGALALFNSTDSNNNTATGALALLANRTGSGNTATGLQALVFNTSGNNNTAIGSFSLTLNATGHDNTAVGSQAGASLTTGSNNIDIGANVGGVAGEANTIRIGKSGTQTKTFIAGIHEAILPAGNFVFVGFDGRLGIGISSARFKEAIKPMDKASEAILALKPVTFRYKKEIDPAGTPQLGLVAEDVEKVNPDLVMRDKEGKPYSVRYDQVNAMLLNEFLKEHKAFIEEQRKVESLEKAMAEQQKENAAMRIMLKDQAAQIQKVSAQLEMSRPASPTVATNP